MKNEGKWRQELDAFLIDLDGVLVSGRRVLPGARELVAFLAGSRYRFAVVTNNSTRSVRQIRRGLLAHGLDIPEDLIFSAARCAAEYVARRAPRPRVLVIGGAGLRAELRAVGVVEERASPQFVVVGLDRRFNYRKLAAACQAVMGGAELVGVNPDRLFPEEGGLVPGCGCLVAAVETCSGRRARIIGKPGVELLARAIARLGTEPSRTAMIGDNPETDIEAGRRLGLRTVLVGSTLAAQARGTVTATADRVFASLSALVEELRGEGR